MSGDWYRLTIPIVVIGLLSLFEMLRRRLLREKYAVIWMAVAFAIALAGVFPDLVMWLTQALGITLPANLLLLGGSFVLLLVSLQLSHEVGRLEEESRTLAEELALLRVEVERLGHAGLPRDSHGG